MLTKNKKIGVSVCNGNNWLNGYLYRLQITIYIYKVYTLYLMQQKIVVNNQDSSSGSVECLATARGKVAPHSPLKWYLFITRKRSHMIFKCE